MKRSAITTLTLAVTLLAGWGGASLINNDAPTSAAAVTSDCANLKPGEAWSGVGLTCGVEVPAPAPAAAKATSTPTSTPTITPTPTPTATATTPATKPAEPAPAPSAPACTPPKLMAEDGSCVPPTFWDTPAPAPVVPVTAPTVKHEEDQPGWKCYIEGNGVCGPTAPQTTEAWSRFTTKNVSPKTLGRGFRVDYMGTAPQGIHFAAGTGEHLTFQADAPNLVHVFLITPNGSN